MSFDGRYHYEIIMGYNLGSGVNPSYMAVAKAVEDLKDNMPDASVIDVVVYDGGPDPNCEVRGVGLDISVEDELEYYEVVTSDDGIESAESLQEISVVRAED